MIVLAFLKDRQIVIGSRQTVDRTAIVELDEVAPDECEEEICRFWANRIMESGLYSASRRTMWPPSALIKVIVVSRNVVDTIQRDMEG
jgi:hypothetical protein